MDIEDYIKEANRQLSYISNYQKLNVDPTDCTPKKIKLLPVTTKMLNKYHQKTLSYLTR